MDFPDPEYHPHPICAESQTISLGMPEVPPIPQIVLCLHFPGTESWNNYWKEFNQKVKEFHQLMIDFNWRIVNWYFLKSKQLARFGKKSEYIAGTIITGPRMTFIRTTTISDRNGNKTLMSILNECR